MQRHARANRYRGVEIELTAAVQALRDELLTAAAAGVDEDIQFAVGPIGLEFAVEFRTSATAKTGFKAWVVSADADASVNRARTHKVTMTLTPHDRAGGDLLVGEAGRAAGPGDVSTHVGR